jgi:hypothetical protein
MTDTVTVQVAKGVKVNVQEVASLSDANPRLPDDRSVIINTPKGMKVAIKGSDGELQSRASAVLTCG